VKHGMSTHPSIGVNSEFRSKAQIRDITVGITRIQMIFSTACTVRSASGPWNAIKLQDSGRA
jgi:hypothetical protein